MIANCKKIEALKIKSCKTINLLRICARHFVHYCPIRWCKVISGGNFTFLLWWLELFCGILFISNECFSIVIEIASIFSCYLYLFGRQSLNLSECSLRNHFMNNEAILTRQFYRPIVLSLHYENTCVIIIHKKLKGNI